MNANACPPKRIPNDLIDDYTMGNAIPIEDRYINSMVYDDNVTVYTIEQIEEYLVKISQRKTFYYNRTDTWLYQALEKFPLDDQEVAVMGSVKPAYESFVIAHGGRPTTIEYNPITCEDSRLKTVTVEEFANQPLQFDSAFSISSFEHDGLGRYGDPLNPNGDLEAMTKMKSIVKENGLLYLAVPIGPDTLVWNAHRVYGPLRLPKLLAGWNLEGFFPSTFPYSGVKDESQPIFVLRNATSDATVVEELIAKLERALAFKRTFRKVKGAILGKKRDRKEYQREMDE